MKRIALYPGSFDPLTFGHADIIERGLALFDEVIVGVARNISKEPMFPFDERVAAIDEAFPQDRVRVAALDGLLVHEAEALGCHAILRGLRNAKDFDYEYQMTSMNDALADTLETVFLMASTEHVFVSSSLVKEVARFGGDVSAFVPPHVHDALMRKLDTSG